MRTSKPKTKAPRRRERHHAPVQPGQLLLFKPQVIALLGIGYTTLYNWMVAGLFPQPVVLGPPGSRTASVAWHADEIHQWLAALPRRELGTHEFRGKPRKSASAKTSDTTPRNLATAMSEALKPKAAPARKQIKKAAFDDAPDDAPPKAKSPPKPTRTRPARALPEDHAP